MYPVHIIFFYFPPLHAGWDEDGIFNFEGGCYAKTVNLSHANEPEIYDAIKRDALLENVIIKVVTGAEYYCSVAVVLSKERHSTAVCACIAVVVTHLEVLQ